MMIINRRRAFVIAALLMHLVPLAHRPSIIGGDEPHYALMAASIATDGDLDLAADYDRVASGSVAAGVKNAGRSLDRHVRLVNGHTVFSHPLGLPLLAAPFLNLQRRFAPSAGPDLLLLLLSSATTFVALMLAMRIVARLTNDERTAALTVLGAYFASPLWFYGRTFFTEPFIWSFLVFAVAALSGSAVILGGVCLAVALMLKETTALFVVPILVLLWHRRGWSALIRALVGPAFYGVAFVAKNVLTTGSPFTTFQAFSAGQPITGAIGLMLDPAHGLIWYAPFLVAGAYGLVRKNALSADIRVTAIVTVCLYFALTAAWIDWRGGSCYATRLLLPLLPVLALGLAWVIKDRMIPSPVLIALFVWGFTVNWCAATDPFRAFWGTPVTELVTRRPVFTVAGAVIAVGLWRVVQRSEWTPHVTGDALA